MCKINCLLYYFFVLILNVGKLCFGDVEKFLVEYFFVVFVFIYYFMNLKKLGLIFCGLFLLN